MTRRLFQRQNKRNRFTNLETLEARHLLASDLVISEFLATNATSLRDDFREYSDWIEIHNPTEEAVSVDGWYLTDDPNDLNKWQFPQVEIEADGFLVVHASTQDVVDPGEELHTNFKLSSSGDYLALVRPDMSVSHAYSPRYPEQRVDVSYGLKFVDGAPQIGEGTYYTDPSPGAANQGEGIIGFTDEVGFSVQRGYYDDAFELTLATSTPGATIRFTTDKTAPSPENGEIYTGPISIPTTTTLRAMAYTEDRLPSTTDTHTYIFLEDVLKQTGEGLPEQWGFFDDQGNTSLRATANYEVDQDIVEHEDYRDTIRDDLRAVPTISLVIDPTDLWSLDDGLYSNSMLKGDRWERPVSMEWLNVDGETEFQVNAGVRIHGGWARRLSQTKKFSFRVNFKSEYGPNLLDHDVFPEDGQQQLFQSLILRGGFNDSWRTSGNTDNTYAQDLWTRQAQRDMGGYSSTDQYVHLYLNGLYWGMYSPTERMNAEWASAYMGGEPDEWDVINTGGNVVDGSSRAFNDLMRAVSGNDVDYEHVKSILDIEGYIDYMIVNQYIGNWDWPHNNWYASRRNVEGEKWRFHSWDAEAAFQRGITENRITLNNVQNVVGPGKVYLGLIQFEEFRELYANRIYKHLFNDGALSEQANIDRLNEITSGADRAIVGESLRWGDGKDNSGRPITRANWTRRIETINNTYFPRRAERLIGFYQQAGLFPEVFPPEFNQFGGRITPEFDIALTTDLPGGDIYYTSDGSDPRGPDGLPSPSAIRLNSIDLVDDESQAKLLIPTGAANEANWQNSEFDDASWTDSSSVIGFDSGQIDDAIAVPDGFTIVEYQSSERLNSVELADAVIAGENLTETETLEGVPFLNFLESTSATSSRNGNFDGDLDFPIGGINFVLDITGKINVQQPGTYTFALTSDDYLRMELDGETLHADEGRHSTSTTLITKELTAGSHDIHAVYFQRTSRAVLEFSYAAGVKTEFDEDFQIVGDIKHRPYNPIIKTDLAASMAGQSSSAYLRIPFEVTDLDNVAGLFMKGRADDGFVAYLNGTRIASQNAPEVLAHDSSATASKPDSDAVAGELIDLTEFKDQLKAGDNVLAIHALNASVDDADFLFKPQVFVTLAEAPINLENSSVIRTRVNIESDWSPIAEASFITSPLATPDDIRISEIHFNPRDGSIEEAEAGFNNRRDFEFIEVVNISDHAIDISELQFEKTPIGDSTEGIGFDFANSDIRELGPGEFAVIVDDLAGFRFRYGDDVPVAGQWSGRLSNSSEKLTLNASGQTVHQFTYLDQWYPIADGGGASLEVFDPSTADIANWGQAATWRPGNIDGTPGSPAEIQPGDSNSDGVFDSSDLVQVFQAGKYEDGIDNNATFEEGDWDGDGDFGTSDLVYAFQLAGYVGDVPAAARSFDPTETNRTALDREVFGQDLDFDSLADDDFLNF